MKVLVFSINVDAPVLSKESEQLVLKSYYNNNNILSVVPLVGSEEVVCTRIRIPYTPTL